MYIFKSHNFLITWQPFFSEFFGSKVKNISCHTPHLNWAYSKSVTRTVLQLVSTLYLRLSGCWSRWSLRGARLNAAANEAASRRRRNPEFPRLLCASSAPTRDLSPTSDPCGGDLWPLRVSGWTPRGTTEWQPGDTCRCHEEHTARWGRQIGD